MRGKRANVSPEELSEASRHVQAQLLETREYANAENLFCYIPIGNEIDTTAIIEDARRAGKRVFIPRIIGDGIMEAVQICDAGEVLSEGRYGIPTRLGAEAVSPARIELVVAPGLAFDRSGTRLGRGGGYYDRFLSTTRAFKIGVAHSFQLINAIDVIGGIARKAWDVPMNALITPNETFYIDEDK